MMRRERVKVSKSCTLTRERRSEHREEKMDSTVKEGRFQGEGRQAKRTFLGEVEGSMSG